MKRSLRVLLTVTGLALVGVGANNSHAISNESATVVREAGQKAATVLQSPKGASIMKAIVGTEFASAVAQYLGVDSFDANNPIQMMSLQTKLANDTSALAYAISKDLLSIDQATGNTLEIGAITAKVADLKLASVTEVKNIQAGAAPAREKVTGVRQAAFAAQFPRKLETYAAGQVDADTLNQVIRLLSSSLWTASEGVHADLCLAADTDFTDPKVLSMVSGAFANMEDYVDQYSASKNAAVALAARNAFHSSLVQQGVSAEGACRGTMDRASGCEVVLPAEACALPN